jgi:hypothetical protein
MPKKQKYVHLMAPVPMVQSGEPIPEDEPCFVFRARDVLAYAALEHYARLVVDQQGDSDHFTAVIRRMREFKQFREQHPDRMKEPDTFLPKRKLFEADVTNGDLSVAEHKSAPIALLICLLKALETGGDHE